MGYSNRPAAIEQVKPYLDEMLQTDEEIVWLTKDPNRFRYLIFQAFSAIDHLAANNPQYQPYAQLRAKFKVECEGNKVLARPRNGVMAVAIPGIDSKMVHRDVSELIDVLAIVNKHNKVTELVFDGYSASELDLHKLFFVAEKYEYHIIPASNTLTLSKKSEDAEIAWTPENA